MIPTPPNATELHGASQRGPQGMRELLGQGTRREQIERVHQAARALRSSTIERSEKVRIIGSVRTFLQDLQTAVEQERSQQRAQTQNQEIDDRLRSLETEASEIFAARQSLLEAERDEANFFTQRAIDVRETWNEGTFGKAAIVSGGILGVSLIASITSWIAGWKETHVVRRFFNSTPMKWIKRAAVVVLGAFGLTKLFETLKNREEQQARVARTVQNQTTQNSQSVAPTTNITQPASPEITGPVLPAAPASTVVVQQAADQAQVPANQPAQNLPSFSPPTSPLTADGLETARTLAELTARVRSLTGVRPRRAPTAQDTELTRMLYDEQGRLRLPGTAQEVVAHAGQRMPRAQALHLLAQQHILAAAQQATPAIGDFRTALLMAMGRSQTARMQAFDEAQYATLDAGIRSELETVTLDADRRITMMQFEETLVAELLDAADRFATHRSQTLGLLEEMQTAVNRMDDGEEKGRRQGILRDLRSRHAALDAVERQLRSALEAVGRAAAVRSAALQERLLATMLDEDAVAQALASIPPARDGDTLSSLGSTGVSAEHAAVLRRLPAIMQTSIPIRLLRQRYRTLAAQTPQQQPPVTRQQLQDQVERLRTALLQQAQRAAAGTGTSPEEVAVRQAAAALVAAHAQRSSNTPAYEAALLAFSEQMGAVLRRQFSDENGIAITRPDGTQAAQRTRLTAAAVHQVLQLNGDAVFEQMFVSRNAANLPRLSRLFGEQVANQVAEHRLQLHMGGQLTHLLLLRNHIGAGTRSADPLQHLSAEERQQFAQATLNGNVVAQLSQEWLRYGVGFDEYLRSLDTVVQQHGTRQQGFVATVRAMIERVQRFIGDQAIRVHNFSWIVPDNVGVRGMRALGAPLPESWDGYNIGELARLASNSVGAEVADPQILAQFLRNWQDDTRAMDTIIQRFDAASTGIRTEVSQTVTGLRSLQAICPPERLALVPGSPQRPAVAVDEAGIRTLGGQYAAAKQALTSAEGAQPRDEARVTQARDAVHVIERQLAWMYTHLLEKLNAPDTGALARMSDEIEKLNNDLTEKIVHHAGNFQALDTLQRSYWQSLGIGVGVTWWTIGMPGLARAPVLNHVPLYARGARFLQRFTPPGAIRPLWNAAGYVARRLPIAPAPGTALSARARIGWSGMAAFQAYNLYNNIQDLQAEGDRIQRLRTSMHSELTRAGFTRDAQNPDRYTHSNGVTLSLRNIEQAVSNQWWSRAGLTGLAAAELGVSALVLAGLVSNPVGITVLAVGAVIETGLRSYHSDQARTFIASCPPWLLVALGARDAVGQSEYDMLINASSWNFINSSEANRDETRRKMYFNIFNHELGAFAPELLQEIYAGRNSTQSIDDFYSGDFKDIVLQYVYVRLFQILRARNPQASWAQVSEGRIDRGWVVLPADITYLEIRSAMREAAAVYVHHIREKRYLEIRARRVALEQRHRTDPTDQTVLDQLTDARAVEQLLAQQQVLGAQLTDALSDAQITANRNQTRTQRLLATLYQQVNASGGTAAFTLRTQPAAAGVRQESIDFGSRDAVLRLFLEDPVQRARLERVAPFTTEEPEGAVMPAWNDWQGNFNRLFRLPTGVDEYFGTLVTRHAANNVWQGANSTRPADNMSEQAARNSITEGAIQYMDTRGSTFGLSHNATLSRRLYGGYPPVFGDADGEDQMALLEMLRRPHAQGGGRAFDLANVRAVIVQSARIQANGHHVVLVTFVYRGRGGEHYFLQNAGATSATARSRSRITGIAMPYNQAGFLATALGRQWRDRLLPEVERLEVQRRREAEQQGVEVERARRRSAEQQFIEQQRQAEVAREQADPDIQAADRRRMMGLARTDRFTIIADRWGRRARRMVYTNAQGAQELITLSYYTEPENVGAAFTAGPQDGRQEANSSFAFRIEQSEVRWWATGHGFLTQENIGQSDRDRLRDIACTPIADQGRDSLLQVMDLFPYENYIAGRFSPFSTHYYKAELLQELQPLYDRTPSYEMAREFLRTLFDKLRDANGITSSSRSSIARWFRNNQARFGIR